MGLFSIIITIIAILLGLFFKDSKRVGHILLFLLFILFTFEYTLEGDGDYSVYENIYDTAGSGDYLFLIGYDPVFVFFFILCNTVGLSFVATKAVVAVISLFFLYKTFTNFTKNYALVLSLFFIFPALLDAELMRWLIAESIVIYGFKYLIRGDGFRDYLFYSIFVTIASLFHSGCLVFFIFLLGMIKRKELVGLSVIVCTLLLISAQSVKPIYSILSSLPFEDTMQGKFQTGYVGNTNAIIESFFRYFVVLSIAFSAVYLTGYNNKVFLLKSNNNLGKLMCSKIMTINIIAFLFVGLNLFSAQAQRMYHVIIVLNYIAFAVKCEGGEKKIIGHLSVIFVSVFLLLFSLYSSEGTLPVFKSHFTIGYITRMFQLVFGQ